MNLLDDSLNTSGSHESFEYYLSTLVVFCVTKCLKLTWQIASFTSWFHAKKQQTCFKKGSSHPNMQDKVAWPCAALVAWQKSDYWVNVGKQNPSLKWVHLWNFLLGSVRRWSSRLTHSFHISEYGSGPLISNSKGSFWAKWLGYVSIWAVRLLDWCLHSCRAWIGFESGSMSNLDVSLPRGNSFWWQPLRISVRGV